MQATPRPPCLCYTFLRKSEAIRTFCEVILYNLKAKSNELDVDFIGGQGRPLAKDEQLAINAFIKQPKQKQNKTNKRNFVKIVNNLPNEDKYPFGNLENQMGQKENSTVPPKALL